MKKGLILAAGVIALSTFAACSVFTDNDITGIDKVVFTADDYSVVDDQPMTKTSLVNGNEFIWNADDTVGIYPNKGSQVFFAMETGAGAKTAVFDGGGWDFKAGASYYCYYPFIGDIYLNRNHIPVSYYGQKHIGTDGTASFGAFDYMYAPKSSAADGQLNFTYHHLNCIIRPRLTLPAGTYTKLAITAPSDLLVVEGYYDLEAESPVIIPTKWAKQIVLDLEGVTLTSETTFQTYLMSAPVDLNGVELTVSVLDSNKKEYQCQKTPTREYTAGSIFGLTCSSWTEVPQSMGMIIDGWGDGGDYSGDAE